VNVLKCILVQKVGFLKHKSGILHGYKINSAGLELDKPGAWPAAGLSVSM
jgi:hypothetical protein